MIIPAVFVFSGTEGMASGPSLMFVSLPKVFNSMGRAGACLLYTSGLLPKGIRTDRRIRDHDTRDGQELILKGAV